MNSTEIISSIFGTVDIYLTFLAVTLTIITKRYAWMLMVVASAVVSILWAVQIH